MKKYKKYILMILLITLLGFYTIWQQITIVKMGKKIEKLEAKKQELQNKLNAQRIVIEELGSPARLMEESKKLGYLKDG